MDSSVSSALTASTAPSAGVGAANKRHSENEEREDSLPFIAQDRGIVIQQRNVAVNTAAVSQQQQQRHQEVVVHDPLTSNPPAMLPSAASEDDSTPFVSTYHTPPTANNDPRMNVDYERHYIVDLEQINEESSGHIDLSSAGRGKFGASGSVSSPRASSASSPPASSPRRATFVSPPRGATVAACTNSDVAKGRRSSGVPLDLEGGGKSKTIPKVFEGQHQQHQQQQDKPQKGSGNPKPDQFYNYRHQYYTEQYHYCDEGFSQSASKCNGDDDSDSTCSSVTLSQAYSNNGADSCTSSITDTECYSESQHTTSPSLMSGVSSVTLSRALSVDKLEHSGQGFYVATRLGDFVEVPAEQHADGNDVMDEPAFFKTVYEEDEEEVSIEVEKNAHAHAHADTDTKSEDIKSGDHTTNGDFSKTSTADELTLDAVSDTTALGSTSSSKTSTADELTLDAVSDMTALGSTSFSKTSTADEPTLDAVSDMTALGSTKTHDTNKQNVATQIAPKAEDIESDIISALVPECGVPIPSIMAKAAVGRKMGRSSRGGMLLPWHSTRSIQNYHGRRDKRLSSSRRVKGSMFSIGSVHTFRG